jgi:predicted ATPase
MRTDDFAPVIRSSTIGCGFVALVAYLGPRSANLSEATHVQTIGEVAVHAFSLTSEAVRSSLAVLQENPRNLCAVYVGEIGLADGDLDSKVRRAADCAEHGEPGQIILTLVAAEIARELLPEGMRLLELGNRSMSDRGIERLFVLESTSPETRLGANARAEREDRVVFIGRNRELAELEDRLGRQRLISVTGPAGIGKTCLIRRMLDEWEDRENVWNVDVSALASPTFLASAINDALEIRKRPTQTHLEALLSHASYREGVLALDTGAQGLQEVRSIVRSLLLVAPNLAVVVAAPRSLRIPNEWSMPLKGLEQPNGPEPWQSLREYDSLRFFESRAAAFVPGFCIDDENAEVVALICKRLGGNPAALTLAASKLKVLSLVQVLNRLDQPIAFLNGSSANSLDRHDSMSTMIRVTIEPLGTQAKEILSKLAVFEGAVGFDDIEGMFPEQASISGFEELVDVGLLEGASSGLLSKRFVLNSAARDYVLTRLPDGDKEDAIACKSRYFEQLSIQYGESQLTMHNSEWLQRLEEQCTDFSATIRKLNREGECERAAKMLFSGMNFWYERNFPQHALKLAEEILNKKRPMPSQARLENFAAIMAFRQGNARLTTDYAEKCIKRARKDGNLIFEAYAHSTLGLLAQSEDRNLEAAEHHSRAADIFRSQGDKAGLYKTLGNVLGSLADTNAYDKGEAIAKEILSLETKDTPKLAIVTTRNNLATLAIAAGKLTQARKYLLDLFVFVNRSGQGLSTATYIRTLAHLLIAEERWTRAALFFGGAKAMVEQEEGHLDRHQQCLLESALAKIRANIGAEKCGQTIQEGYMNSTSSLVELAIEESST